MGVKQINFVWITSAAVRNRQRQPRSWNTAALISSQIRCRGTRTRRRSTARAGLLLPAPRSSETSLGKTSHDPGFNERGGARGTATVDREESQRYPAPAVLSVDGEGSEDFQNNVK